MSEENLELVGRVADAYARHGWQALVQFMHPEFEIITRPEVAMEPDTYRGEQGLRRYFESFEEAMEDIRFVPVGEALDAGDKVFLPFKLTARGRETGIEAEQHAFQVVTLRDAKVLRIEVFATREDALHAAGLDADT